MKKYILTILSFMMITGFAFSQKSLTPICKYTFKDTEVKPDVRGDTSEIFYKGQSVGYAFCEKTKNKGNGTVVVSFINHIYNHDMVEIATVAGEGNQLLIKYKNPYKIVYVKGLQYNNVIRQMVEVDLKLTPKQ